MRMNPRALLVVIIGIVASLVPDSVWAVSCDTLPPRRDTDFDSVAVIQFQGGASCWGWEAPDGRHYAIMGGQRSIGFVDVQTMTVVDTVPTQFCQWRELKTYRNYCYAVSECVGDKQGMMIIDMKYLPDSVHYVGSYVSGSNVRSHCISIDTARGYCYLVRQNYSGFRIVSLANPEAPVDVGGVTTGDLHDMTAFNDTVYAAEANSGSFSIWNCTNKAAPVMLARVTIPGGGYVHNLWPSDDRRFLVSTEEVPAGRTMKVWNIENLGNIYMVDQYLGPGQIPHNAHVEKDYLFVSHYTSGVSVLDFNFPECLVVKTEFDTYLNNNNADYAGCWGVYPHTNGSGWVYASNIDGRLFIFNFTVYPYAASAEFSATPRLGQVPLDVNFTSSGLDLTQWDWDFGDGGASPLPNPMHTYTAPGVYDVSLAVAGGGVDTMVRSDYVIALAETLLVADTGFDRGTQVVWSLNLRNFVPLEELRIPIAISDIPGSATLDSVSYGGCRTEYFEQKNLVFDQSASGQIVLLLRADAGGQSPYLSAGSGPIARLHLTIAATAVPGDSLKLTTPTIWWHTLNAKTVGTSFVPRSQGAAAVITGPPCDCSCHGDPICDGGVNIQDVVKTIDVAFRNAAPTTDASCSHSGRTDVDCSGATTVLDVVLMVGASFRNEDPAQSFCDPCE